MRTCRTQNLAREAANSFGHTNVAGSVERAIEDDSSFNHTCDEPESSIVVTAISSHIEANRTNNESELRTQSRGFFADQFEVGPLSQ